MCCWNRVDAAAKTNVYGFYMYAYIPYIHAVHTYVQDVYIATTQQVACPASLQPIPPKPQLFQTLLVSPSLCQKHLYRQAKTLLHAAVQCHHHWPRQKQLWWSKHTLELSTHRPTFLAYNKSVEQRDAKGLSASIHFADLTKIIVHQSHQHQNQPCSD